MKTIDRTDWEILRRLQPEARTSLAELARHLQMAPSAVHQRVRRLESEGVVRGYQARIDPEAVGCGLLAFIHLRTRERLDEFRIAERIAALPGVLEVHDIAGDDCYLLKVRAADTNDLHRLIREEIGVVEGVESTKTTIVLKTISEHRNLPLSPESQPNPSR